jgi:murein L,D-transpeptidase YcbB/YkuD
MGTWEGPIRVNLPAAMPLHVVYMTAWVDDAGRPIFRDDVYNLDGEVLEALEARSANGVQLALAD